MAMSEMCRHDRQEERIMGGAFLRFCAHIPARFGVSGPEAGWEV